MRFLVEQTITLKSAILNQWAVARLLSSEHHPEGRGYTGTAKRLNYFTKIVTVISKCAQEFT